MRASTCPPATARSLPRIYAGAALLGFLLLAGGYGQTEEKRLPAEKQAQFKRGHELIAAVIRQRNSKPDLELITRLLDAGADLSVSDKTGKTALMWAAYSGHAAIVELLINAGADVNHQSNDGYTVLMSVSGVAEYTENAAIVELLINAGVDVNIQTKAGATALMFAILWGNEELQMGPQSVEIVKLLINAGADVNIRDHDGRTALSWVRRFKNAGIERILLEAGATE